MSEVVSYVHSIVLQCLLVLLNSFWLPKKLKTSFSNHLKPIINKSYTNNVTIIFTCVLLYNNNNNMYVYILNNHIHIFQSI